MIVICIAVGSGANTALFTVAQAVLLRPLPFQDAEALVTANIDDIPQGSPFSVAEVGRLQEQVGRVVELSARTHAPVSIEARGTATRSVQSEFVADNYFDLLRQPVAHGRAPGPNVRGVVLSDRFWRVQFGADPAIVGRSILLSGTPVEVIGIAPPGFNGAMQLVSTDIWVPLSEAPRILKSERLFDEPWVGIVGRLREDVSIAQLQAATDAVAARVIERPSVSGRAPRIIFGPAEGVGAPPALRSMIGATFAAVWIVAAALLVISTANAAGLMLISGIRREPEMAMRLALGASVRRLALQLTAEAGILVVLGTIASLVLTGIVTSAAAQFTDSAAAGGGLALDLRIDSQALAFTLLVSAVATFAAALAPVRHVRQLKDSAVLRTATASPSRRTHQVLSALAVAQVACTLAPAAILGVVLGDLRRPADDIGFAPERVSAFTVNLQQSELPLAVVMKQMEQSAARGTDLAVAWTTRAPLSGRPPTSPVAVSDRGGWRELRATVIEVSPEYFAVLQAPVQAGRAFGPADDPNGVAIVSRRLADVLHDPSLQQSMSVRIGSERPLAVIGVVGDIPYGSALDDAAPVVYRPLTPDQLRSVTMMTNSALPFAGLAETVQRQVDTMTAGRAASNGVSLRRRLTDVHEARQRFAGLLTAAAAISIILSVCGLALVVAYVVQARLREFALRRALGAGTADVAARVVRQATVAATAGAVIGMLLSAAFLQVLGSAIAGLDRFSIAMVAVPGATLVVIVVLGTLEPLMRAVRAEPADLLRTT